MCSCHRGSNQLPHIGGELSVRRHRDGRQPRRGRRFDEFLRESRIRVEPVTEEQVKLARAAYRDFGKGSGNPARLNFGDCFAYALAKAVNEPLLFKGTDFRRTDIRAVLE